MSAPKLTKAQLRRRVDMWEGLRPAAVVSGSVAQAQYCIEDAQHDILLLARLLQKFLDARIEAHPAGNVYALGQLHDADAAARAALKEQSR